MILVSHKGIGKNFETEEGRVELGAVLSDKQHGRKNKGSCLKNKLLGCGGKFQRLTERQILHFNRQWEVIGHKGLKKIPDSFLF